jgi:hypothetical protein
VLISEWQWQSNDMNWIEFLNDNLIEFVTGGANTSKNHISINCPFCEGSDPSQHMGINLTNNHWYCWRDKTHRGSKPEFLISRLLRVSASQARLLCQAYEGAIDQFDALGATISAPQAIVPITWPTEFEPLTERYLNYLFDRGFDQPKKLAAYYNLECCQVGRWKQRLIIPVLDKDRNILGWQGRVIVKPKIAPRYLTSHQQVKRNVFNLQNLNEDGEILFVCEGPIDSIKIDFYGKPRFKATCLFGVSPTLDQVVQLSNLMHRFKKTIILFDLDAAGISGGFGLSDWLSKVTIGGLPIGYEDPGSLSKKEIHKFLQMWI